MKPMTPTILTSLFLSFPAFSTGNIPDLKVDCVGSFEIVTTSDPFYKDAHCPGGRDIWTNGTCGRANPVPASAGFAFTAKVVSTSDGCKALVAKYGANALPQEIKAKSYLKPATSLSYAQSAAAQAVGAVGTFSFSNAFRYVEKGSLPLFPLLHEETLIQSLQLGIDDGVSAVATLATDVDEKLLYGSKTKSELSDAEKLWAVGIIKDIFIPQVKLAHPRLNENLSYELQGLVPQFLEGKKLLLESLLDILAAAASPEFPNSNFFRFHVGGSQGTELGELIVSLSHAEGILSSEEKAQIVAHYPALTILGWSATGKDSFDITPGELEAALALMAEMLASAPNYADAPPHVKAMWSSALDVARYLKSNVANGIFGNPAYKTPKALALADEILAHK